MLQSPERSFSPKFDKLRALALPGGPLRKGGKRSITTEEPPRPTDSDFINGPRDTGLPAEKKLPEGVRNSFKRVRNNK